MLQNQSQSEDSEFDTHDPKYSLIHHNVKLTNFCLNPSGKVAFAYIILPSCYIKRLKKVAQPKNKIEKTNSRVIRTRT